MSARTLRWLSVLGLSVSLLGCSEAGRRPSGEEDPGDGTSSGGGGGQSSSGGGGGIGGGNSTDYGRRVKMTGVTYAPNGTLPLGNTMVYWSQVAPEPIPEGAYCDTCVEVPEGTSVFSNPDGTFELDVPVDAQIYLITQKGQFRRVRQVEYTESQTTLPADLTTLPGSSAGANDTVPKIAIATKEGVSSSYDPVWDALEKLGVREYTILEDNDSSALTNTDRLSQYHVALINCGQYYESDTREIDTLRAYAERGGKVYVSDHALEYINNGFPGFTTLQTTGKFQAAGRFPDPELDAWMQATGSTNVRLEGMWSYVTKPLSATTMTFADGSSREIVPKVWAEVQRNGNWETSSFSFEYGCGRGMFSTFHAHAAGNALAPQEKALLYMLLEVSACVSGGVVN